MDLIPDNPFTFFKFVITIMKWISDHVPWWMIILIGLFIAVFVPLLV